MFKRKKSKQSIIFSLEKYSEKSMHRFSEGTQEVAPHFLYQTCSSTPHNKTAAVPANRTVLQTFKSGGLSFLMQLCALSLSSCTKEQFTTDLPVEL